MNYMEPPYPPFRIQPAPHPSRDRICEIVQHAPDGWVVTIQEETRTLEQNRLMWPLLTLWAKHRQANVNGKPTMVSKEAWKVIHVCDWRQEEAVQPQMCLTPGGVIVPLGFETHAMPKGDFRRLLSWLLAETNNNRMELPPRLERNYGEYLGRTA